MLGSAVPTCLYIYASLLPFLRVLPFCSSLFSTPFHAYYECSSGGGTFVSSSRWVWTHRTFLHITTRLQYYTDLPAGGDLFLPATGCMNIPATYLYSSGYAVFCVIRWEVVILVEVEVHLIPVLFCLGGRFRLGGLCPWSSVGCGYACLELPSAGSVRGGGGCLPDFMYIWPVHALLLLPVQC
jgi:hypothetical protein